MVNAIRAVFISCDAPMAEFIVTLNDSMPEPERFILDRLEDTHMYVLPHAAARIRRHIAESSKTNSNYRQQQQQQQRKTTVKFSFQDA